MYLLDGRTEIVREEGRGAYEAHGCAEDEDKILVAYGTRGGEEEVGEGQVQEGHGADYRGCGDDGHFQVGELLDTDGGLRAGVLEL